MKNSYDVIVIGGGHAGLEAMAAAARSGASVAFVTISAENIGEMSCNPAIGGLGKGHIVREIDALDGLMAKIIDKAGIHFKILNASKGSAVQGPRAQADRKLYKKFALEELQNYQDNYKVDVIYSMVEDIILNNNQIQSIVLGSGNIINTKAVVLTTGTFLNGVIHVGSETTAGGRFGDKPSIGLSKFLRAQNFEVGRLKTGTPARLNKNTINWDILEVQHGDEIPVPFSFLNKEINTTQVACYISETTEQTHQIIKDNISKSAMYSGNISGAGPRYCPSIEDKVVRFASKNKHQVFLEPEGLDSDLIYPNGISTSLPKDVQEQFIRSMKGLDKVDIIRYGYAIEYDYVNPQELRDTLETKKIKGLFLAGQINGTTGYEEAGGQGLVAGVNAAILATNTDQSYDEINWFKINRNEGYIGVMIDDLIYQGVSEPYRMFSSRAEYRMHLRCDNADARLTSKGYDYGFVSQIRQDVFIKKYNLLNEYKTKMQNYVITPSQIKAKGIHVSQDGVKRTALELLCFSSITFDDLILLWKDLKEIPQDLRNIINIDCKYKNYLKRQAEEIRQFKKEENFKIPSNINYENVNGLSSELIEKFNKIKPSTIGAALRIQGVTPSSIIAIQNYLKKQKLEV